MKKIILAVVAVGCAAAVAQAQGLLNDLNYGIGGCKMGRQGSGCTARTGHRTASSTTGSYGHQQPTESHWQWGVAGDFNRAGEAYLDQQVRQAQNQYRQEQQRQQQKQSQQTQGRKTSQKTQNVQKTDTYEGSWWGYVGIGPLPGENKKDYERRVQMSTWPSCQPFK